jgi:hypothetical protein
MRTFFLMILLISSNAFASGPAPLDNSAASEKELPAWNKGTLLQPGTTMSLLQDLVFSNSKLEAGFIYIGGKMIQTDEATRIGCDARAYVPANTVLTVHPSPMKVTLSKYNSNDLDEIQLSKTGKDGSEITITVYCYDVDNEGELGVYTSRKELLEYSLPLSVTVPAMGHKEY